MIFKEILNEYLTEEAFENSLLLLDIDDTLLKAQNIYIYRKLPSDKQEVKLTPDQYAQESVTAATKQYYNYRDFDNAEIVGKSIKTGLPIVSNLQLMDSYIKKGWKIGILTARGMEDVIFDSMKAWLKIKDKKGNLKDIGDKLVRDLVFAINDDKKRKTIYKGETDFERKANVIKDLSKKYNRIIFIDDDIKNIKKVKQLKLKNVMTKIAEKRNDT